MLNVILAQYHPELRISTKLVHGHIFAHVSVTILSYVNETCICLTLTWTSVSLLGLALPPVIIPPDQSHPCITNTHHRPVENIDLRLCQVVLQHEYSFPKFGSGLCLIFSFQFYNLCHKECVCLVLTWPAYL